MVAGKERVLPMIEESMTTLACFITIGFQLHRCQLDPFMVLILASLSEPLQGLCIFQ
jgi:hypothetical protein